MIKVDIIKTCCVLGYMTGPEEKGITVRRRGCMRVPSCQIWGHSHITPPRSAVSAGTFNNKGNNHST